MAFSSPDRDHALLDTCATDSLCQTACPVLIDTGLLVKRLRADAAGSSSKAVGRVAAGHWAAATAVASTVLDVAAAVPTVARSVTRGLRSVFPHEIVPLWTEDLPSGGSARSRLGHSARSDVVLLPSCMSAMFGGSGSGAAAFLDLCDRVGLDVQVPRDVDGLCCGTPWRSKGLVDGAEAVERQLGSELSQWAGDGVRVIVIDGSTCASPVASLAAGLPEFGSATVVEVVAFTQSALLPLLPPLRQIQRVGVHPTCGTERIGTRAALLEIASACAREVIVADSWGCCAFAGDRGLLHPELTASATASEAAELLTSEATAYVTDNRPCALAMNRATRHGFRHVRQLLADCAAPLS